MSKTDAEYMRAYRARRKAEAAQIKQWTDESNAANEKALREVGADTHADLLVARVRITELEAEVKHLKAELAKRPVVEEPITMPNGDAGHQWRRAPYSEPGFNSRPFTPAPKTHR